VVGERRARAGGAVQADARVRRGRCRGEATEARGCDMQGARAAEHPNCTRRAGKKAAAPKAEEAPAPAETPAAE